MSETDKTAPDLAAAPEAPAAQDAGRPDMKRISPAMAAVTGTALGALTGLGLEIVVAGAGRMFGGAAGRSFRERVLSTEGGLLIGAVAGSSGASGYAAAKAHNKVLDKVEPYVERLEREKATAKAALAQGAQALGS